MESLSDIVAEYRRDYEDMKAKRLYLPTAEYLRRLLDRIEAEAKRDERLMLSLMLYAVEDYVEDWAGRNYKSCVQSACERLGIEFRPAGRGMWEQIEEKLNAMGGAADGNSK